MILRALVLADTVPLRKQIGRMLREAEVVVETCDDNDTLFAKLECGGFDLLVAVAWTLPQPWGRTVAAVGGLPEQTGVVAIVAADRPEDRAALLAAGVFAVLSTDLDSEKGKASLRAVVDRFREIALSRLRIAGDLRGRIASLASNSPAMRRLLDLARRVAAVDTTLLILGETGVGKEWLARAIHADGPRSAAPFVPLNCAAVPESLMESELFGHEAGAFTGAIRARRGAFELAHRGTLFLDEVGDLPVHLQGKLLRVLQDKQIQRLGAERPVDVDVRIIAATNRDLHSAIDQGTFRRDLFYRLSVVTLPIPPLRERLEDVRALATACLEHFRGRFGRPRLEGFSAASLAALDNHHWPGNVRELVNAVERAVLLADGEWIEPGDLLLERQPHPAPPRRERPSSRAIPEPRTDLSLPAGRQAVVEAFEKSYLERALAEHEGRLADAARASGIDTRTLYNKMRAYGLRRRDFRPPKR